MQTLTRSLRWAAHPAHFAALVLAAVPAGFLVAFMLIYGTPYPIDDTVRFNWRLVVMPLALGEFEPSALFRSNQGHRAFFTNLTAALSYRFLGWNQTVETWALFGLTTVNIGLMTALFARHNRARVHWLLPAAAALMFSTAHGVLYLSPLHSHWHYSVLFALLTTVAVVYRAPTWRTVALAAALSFAGTFTMGNGFITWAVGLLAMLLSGWRDPRKLGVYAAVGALALALYVLPGDFGGNDMPNETDMETLVAPSARLLAGFVLAYAGAPLSSQVVRAALAAGGVGVGVLALNSVYLWRVGWGTRLAPWLPLAAHGLLTGALLAIARPDTLHRALMERTIMSASVFWVAVVAVALLAIAHATEQGRAWPANLNTLLLASVLSAHLVGLYTTTDTYRTELPVTALLNHAECHERVAFRYEDGTNPDCLFELRPGEIDIMAAHNLAGFREVTLPSALAPTDEPVLIVTTAGLHGIHIRDRMLEAPNTALLYDASDELAADVFPTLPEPPAHVFAGDRAAALDFVTRPLSFTTVVHQSVTDWPTTTRNVPAGYAVYESRPVPGYGLAITRYRTVPQVNPVEITYGDAARLVGWWVPSALEVVPCEAVRLQSLWEPLPGAVESVGLSFVMVDASGEGITQATGEPLAPSYTWDRADDGRRTLDERKLTVPCDTAPGTYALSLGAYDMGTGAEHPATYTDGTPVGGLYYLTTLTVQ